MEWRGHSYYFARLEESQITSRVLMVHPRGFGRNEETASTNAFMHRPSEEASGEAGGMAHPARVASADISMAIRDRARDESDRVVLMLRDAGVRVAIDDEPALEQLPDAVFPNNWFSTHRLRGDERRLITYPMLAPSRRRERREHVIETIRRELGVDYTVEREARVRLESHETRREFLEGTGSLVLDRMRGVAFAARSPRTSETALRAFAHATGYRVVMFDAASRDSEGMAQAVYHTNVMMAVGAGFAVWCPECVGDASDRQTVERELIESAGHDRGFAGAIIEISIEQMNAFAGNVLHLESERGGRVIAMSTRAFEAFTASQRETLKRFGKLVHTPIPTIEAIGGGGVRCMLAEVF
jgi:hypothetical protein